jgi:hypothetical protein
MCALREAENNINFTRFVHVENWITYVYVYQNMLMLKTSFKQRSIHDSHRASEKITGHVVVVLPILMGDWFMYTHCLTVVYHCVCVREE